MGSGTFNYATYKRDHTIQAEHKPVILGSSDPAFRGDKSRYNPEELLLASLSSCHMLWYLDLCTKAGIIVVEYVDHPVGIMVEDVHTGGRFTEVTLHPKVTVTEAAMEEEALALHKKANELCFIANSVNFPVHHEPVCLLFEV